MVGLGVDAKKLESGLRSSKKKVKQFEKGIVKSGSTSRKVTGSMGKDFDRLGQKINRRATAAVLVFTAAISAAAVKTASLGREFSAATADISAITGAVGEDLKFLTESSLELGSATTLSAVQVSQAFALVASAKPDLLTNLPALKAVTKEVITLAEATGTTAAEATNTLATALNQFGMSADQASRFINVLAAGSQKGASLVPQTGEAIRIAGVAASGAGLSFEEFNASIQTLAINGIKASDAGTALRNIILRLSTGDIARFNPTIVGWMDAFDNLADAELTAKERLDLFGIRAISMADVLIKNTDITKKLVKETTGTSTAYEQAKTKADSYDGKLKSLNSAMEGAQLLIFDKFKPALISLAESFRSVAIKVGENADVIVEYAAALGKGALGLGIGLALAGMAALITKLGAVTVALATTTVGVNTLKASLTILGAAGFIGFQIGTKLHENFAFVRKSASLMVGAILKGFNQLAAGAAKTAAFIKNAFSEPQDAARSLLSGGLKVGGFIAEQVSRLGDDLFKDSPLVKLAVDKGVAVPQGIESLGGDQTIANRLFKLGEQVDKSRDPDASLELKEFNAAINLQVQVALEEIDDVILQSFISNIPPSVAPPEFIDVAAERRKTATTEAGGLSAEFLKKNFPGASQVTPGGFQGGFPELKFTPKTEINVEVNIDGEAVAAKITKRVRTTSGFQSGQGLVTPIGGRFFDKEIEDIARTVAR